MAQKRNRLQKAMQNEKNPVQKNRKPEKGRRGGRRVNKSHHHVGSIFRIQMDEGNFLESARPVLQLFPLFRCAYRYYPFHPYISELSF